MQQEIEQTSIGYFFIVFQSTLTGFVKCWFDGDEYFNYMSEDDFLDMVSKEDREGQVIIKVSQCLSSSGVYLWDVQAGTISPLRPQPMPEDTVASLLKTASPSFSGASGFKGISGDIFF